MNFWADYQRKRRHLARKEMDAVQFRVPTARDGSVSLHPTPIVFCIDLSSCSGSPLTPADTSWVRPSRRPTRAGSDSHAGRHELGPSLTPPDTSWVRLSRHPTRAGSASHATRHELGPTLTPADTSWVRPSRRPTRAGSASHASRHELGPPLTPTDTSWVRLSRRPT